VTWDFENRLDLARRMGYPCGDGNDRPARAGAWFTKPIRNPSGMGIGAGTNAWLDEAPGSGPGWARVLEPGFMWMPAFEGEHYSVDFRRRGGRWEQALTVRCAHDRRRARPARWLIEARAFDVPAPLRGVDGEWLNVEFIGAGVIEAQGRRNTDFDLAPREAREARVVWADQMAPAAMTADLDDADGQLAVPRLGFVYR
jgi:hypothetical protein